MHWPLSQPSCWPLLCRGRLDLGSCCDFEVCQVSRTVSRVAVGQRWNAQMWPVQMWFPLPLPCLCLDISISMSGCAHSGPFWGRNLLVQTKLKLPSRLGQCKRGPSRLTKPLMQLDLIMDALQSTLLWKSISYNNFDHVANDVNESIL